MAPGAHRYKLALAGAALLLALVSACNTAIPLFLGQLVDRVQQHMQQGAEAERLISSAAVYLGLIAAAYVLREGLQVCRRNLVESTCTRIEKLMTVKPVAHLLKADLAALSQERLGSLHLSGGQRQRLALARVFLKNPPILVLDEGTSALDNINERRVQQAIDQARADRTVILVAHRLSTLVDTDRILVFDNGRIVEEGSYDGLVQAGRVFTELVRCAGTQEERDRSPVADGVGGSSPAHPQTQQDPAAEIESPEVQPEPASAVG